MEEQAWTEEVTQLCLRHEWYQRCLEKAKKLEPVYEQIRENLTEEQREFLDQYIMACEEMDHIRQMLAYQLGKRHR